jgi:hypothetical protein
MVYIGAVVEVIDTHGSKCENLLTWTCVVGEGETQAKLMLLDYYRVGCRDDIGNSFPIERLRIDVHPFCCGVGIGTNTWRRIG